MANELIRPIDADTARAIEEAAKTAGKAVDAAVKAGGYGGAVLGDLPHHTVGILRDWIVHKRARRWVELNAETDRILRERGVENREEVSPSVAIPLIDAALNEDRDGLKHLWAKLLAAAMDPKRTQEVRPSLIELLKQLDPLDARVIEVLVVPIQMVRGDLADHLSASLGVLRIDAYYSLEHLYELKCLTHNPIDMPRPNLTAKAQILLRAVHD